MEPWVGSPGNVSPAFVIPPQAGILYSGSAGQPLTDEEYERIRQSASEWADSPVADEGDSEGEGR